jgi:hypothetical protein
VDCPNRAARDLDRGQVEDLLRGRRLTKFEARAAIGYWRHHRSQAGFAKSNLYLSCGPTGVLLTGVFLLWSLPGCFLAFAGSLSIGVTRARSPIPFVVVICGVVSIGVGMLRGLQAYNASREFLAGATPPKGKIKWW